MLIKLALAAGLLATYPAAETFECEVAPLEDYGFVQFGERPEYICVSPDDDTDFIVIEDKGFLNIATLNIGDTMKVELKDDEVVKQYRIKSLNSL